MDELLCDGRFHKAAPLGNMRTNPPRVTSTISCLSDRNRLLLTQTGLLSLPQGTSLGWHFFKNMNYLPVIKMERSFEEWKHRACIPTRQLVEAAWWLLPVDQGFLVGDLETFLVVTAGGRLLLASRGQRPAALLTPHEAQVSTATPPSKRVRLRLLAVWKWHSSAVHGCLCSGLP